MLERPSFKSHYYVEVVEGEGIVLLSEQDQSLVAGRLYELVTPFLDGRRSVSDIVHQLRDRASPVEVSQALTDLETKGYLAEGDETMPPGEAALWAIQDIAPQTAARRLREISVSVTAVGAVDIAPFVAILEALHVRVDQEGDFGVVLTDDYLRRGLQAYNEEALRQQRPWMLVKPAGCEIWVGPIFRPEKTGCWECLAQRLRAKRVVETFLQQKSGAEPSPLARSCTPATQQVAWNLAAIKIATWIARGELPDLEGHVLTLDVRSWQTHSHTLVWRPQCPACGDLVESWEGSAPPLVLTSCRKTFTQDGGHRVVSPEITLQRYQHHVSPITGAVSRLERYGLPTDGVLHAYAAGHTLAMPGRNLKALREGLRSYSAGKGASDVQARASGLCEALERHSSVFRGDEPRHRARFKDLGDAAVHPNLCMRFSDRQYQQREVWNAKHARCNFVPVPFDEGAAIDWAPVWSLTRRENRFLPTAYCYYNYPAPPEAYYCASCSNGNAAGNTLEEAILQGFLELVERDAVALWWYNRVHRPAVDLDSFDSPYLSRLRAYLHGRHRSLWVLDLTTDLDVPAFAALSRHMDQQPENIVFGFGAHLDPTIAVLRAVTEMNQSLAWVLSRRDGESAAHDGDTTEFENWLKTATLTNQPYLVPDARTPPRVASDYPRRWSEDLKEDVLACQALVERHGLEMLVLDQTRPDIGLPVAKVIVPGLRHFWARFAPGRLYEAPVHLGWLTQPLAEEQLNPMPMFL